VARLEFREGLQRSGRANVAMGLDRAQDTWPFPPVAALFAVCWVLFGWPWLTGSVTIPWDAKAQFAPQAQFLAASIARGESPFWNPFAFGGHPQIADPQSLIFSPPFLILALINGTPSLRAIDATVLAMVLAGGLGVLWLARDRGWHWVGAVIAALGFCFGASMAWRLQHFGQVLSLAYLPFALLFLKRGLEQGSWLYGLGAGVMGAFIVLGRDQVGLLCVYVLIGYVIWHFATADDRRQAIATAVRPLVAGLLGGLALVAIPIALTIQLAGQSNRPEIDYPGAAAGSLHPALFITALIPHLFGAAGKMEDFWGPPSFAWENTGLFTAQNMGQLYLGAIPLLLLVAGTVRGIFWDREVRFLSLALIFVVLYALGGFTPLFRVVYELLPGVKLFRRPADATFLIGGIASLLAGYAAHRAFTWTMPQAKPWQRVAEVAVIAGGVLFAIGAAIALNRTANAVEPMLWASAWLAIGALCLRFANVRRTIAPIAAGVTVIALTAVDLSWNNGPNGATAMAPAELEMLEPASRNPTLAFLRQMLAKPVPPDRRDRVELIGLGFHWPNASLTHGLEQTLGYNPVRLKLYSDATAAGDSSGSAGQRKFSKLMPSYKSPLVDLLGLRYIVSGVPLEKIDPTLKGGDFKPVVGTPDGIIYENPRALPRVLFATRAVAMDFGKRIAEGGMPDIDYRATVLLEAGWPGPVRRPGTAKIIHYTNTLIELEAESLDGGWLVLNDVWHPAWLATVNGRPEPVQRANVLFRAVLVPAGKVRVTFAFQPLRGLFSAGTVTRSPTSF
jgi:hypothetical protein